MKIIPLFTTMTSAVAQPAKFADKLNPRLIPNFIPVLLALLVCLCLPHDCFGDGSETQNVPPSGGSGEISHNEDSKADVDMYIEYMPVKSGTSTLQMQLFYHGIDRGGKYVIGECRDDNTEAVLLNNTDMIYGEEFIRWGGDPWVLIPVENAGNGTEQGWMRSRVYRMQDRPANRIYKTPSLLGNNVAKYRLHYIVPEGFEMYWRPAGSTEPFRPGTILESDKFGTGSISPASWQLAGMDKYEAASFRNTKSKELLASGMFSNSSNPTSAYETVVLPKNAPGALPGKATSINSANGEMRFSLGFLANGKSAGFLDFLHDLRYFPLKTVPADLSQYTNYYSKALPDESWPQVTVLGVSFGPPPAANDLKCVSFSDEVKVIMQQPSPDAYDRPAIRQIIAPQCIVDVSQDGFDLVVKFYSPDKKGNRITQEKDLLHGDAITYAQNEGPFDMTKATPMVTYRITWEAVFPADDIAPNINNGTYKAPEAKKCDINVKYIITRVEDGKTYTSTSTVTDSISFVSYTMGELIECPACGGTGDDCCEECGGSGDCQECGGHLQVECPACGGDGQASGPGESFVDCSVCGGTGWVRCSACQHGECSACGGVGNYGECDACGGLGRLPTVEQDGYIDSESPQVKTINVNGFDSAYSSTAITHDPNETITFPYDDSYAILRPKLPKVNENYYFSMGIYNKDTDTVVDNGSTTSRRHYFGGFPAFNIAYRFTNGSGPPLFSSGQQTQVLADIREGDANAVSGYAITTAFDYYSIGYSDPRHDTHHGRMKWQTSPDGSWTMYDYSSDLASLGRVTKVVTPWLDEPMPADVPSTGPYCITTYTYAADWEGVKRLPATITKTANGQTVGQTTNTYSAETGAYSAPVWKTTSAAKPSSGGNALVTITKIYEGANFPASLDWLRGMPYSTEAPDGSKESVAYQRNAGGYAFRSIVLKGISTTNAGTSPASTTLSTYEGLTIDPINMIPNVSTAEVTIRDQYARTIRTETQLYTGGASFVLIDSADMQYDIAGNLTRRKKLNGTLYTATYSGGRKINEGDEQGVTTTFAYDARGRVSSTTREAIRPLPALTTTFTYDNENRVLTTTVGSGADALVTEKEYDSTGRVVKEKNQGLTTTYKYIVSGGAIIRTEIILPSGAQRIIENFLDGRPKSITGSAAPAESYSYTVDANGITTTQNIGATRWVKTTTDWLGRTISQTQPAANGSGNITQTTTYNDKGQVSKTQTTGPGVNLAPTLYFYDANGVMNKHGLSISGNANLDDATDRKYTFNYDYRQKDGALWNYSETFAYPDGATAGVTQTKTWTRVTGLGSEDTYGTLIAESIAEDANGNQAKTQTYLDCNTGETTTLTYAPFATQPAIAVAVVGLLVEQTSPAGVTTTYGYDGLLRPVSTTDRTGATTITYEAGSTRIATITDSRGVTQHIYTYDKNTGRLVSDQTPRIDPATGKASGVNTSNYSYHPTRGWLMGISGDVPYPVTYDYNDYGQRILQKTYRSEGGEGDPTTFDYDPVTGVLLKRTDAQGRSTEYSYTALGQLASRTWARGVTTTYAYINTGALTNADYTDGTPALSYGYDRLGRIKTVTDATGTRTFTYRPGDLKPDQEQLDATFYDARILANQYAPSTARYTGLKVKNGTAEDYSVSYTYNPADARLATIVNNSNFETFTYSYLANSNLISSVTSASSVVNRTYETNRNLLANLETKNGSQVLIAAYAYTHDDLGRRIKVAQTGKLYDTYTATGQTMQTAYGYNNRNEVITALTTVGDTVLKGRNFGYDFDPIGNRVTEKIDNNPFAYATNSLNQYTQRNTPWWLPVSGIANHGNGAQVTINGQQPDTWLNSFYYKAEQKTPNPSDGNAHLQTTTITGAASTGATITETRKTLARPATENFEYDLDGNLTKDSLWTYSYDGENRLITMTSRVADSPTQCVKFTYDYMGRRVRKNVYNDAAGTNLKTSTVFLYQGWTLLCEYSSASVTTLSLVRRYTWGPDLSGTMGGAGDIGGLLAIEDLRPNWKGTFHPAYNGNGDLMALTEASTGNIVASYEYTPFGEPLRTSGIYAKANPIRFSGKYHDTETGLSYFGFRYYSASLGRFINRDPLEEMGGWNLYSGLDQRASDPYAGASGVEGTSWSTNWEQAQDRLLKNTSLPHTTQTVTFDGKRNSGLPGAAEENQKSYSANATGHYSQGGAPGADPQPSNTSVADPAEDNININLYSYCGNNPIMRLDPVGLDPIYGRGGFLWLKIKKIGDDGKHDGKSYLVKGSVASDVKKATKAGENYTGSLAESNKVMHIPTGQKLEGVLKSVEDTRASQKENGGNSNVGDANVTRWDEGTPAEATVDENGNPAVKASMKIFVVKGKNTLPADTSKVDFWWHVHPPATVNGVSLGDSDPSEKDKKAQDLIGRRGFKGNTFVIGARSNTVTFYNKDNELMTVKLSDFIKMGRQQE